MTLRWKILIFSRYWIYAQYFWYKTDITNVMKPVLYNNIVWDIYNICQDNVFQSTLHFKDRCIKMRARLEGFELKWSRICTLSYFSGENKIDNGKSVIEIGNQFSLNTLRILLTSILYKIAVMGDIAAFWALKLAIIRSSIWETDFGISQK